MKKSLCLLTVTFGFSFSVQAANIYVGPSDKCGASASGASWAACKSWDSYNGSFAGGNTYFLMDGSYAGKNLNKSANASSMTIIRKATAEDGGGTLPSNVTVSGQAIFTSGFKFFSSYWTIDGVKGSWSTNPIDYGFRFSDGITFNFFIDGYHLAGSDITMSHVAAKAPAGDQQKPFFRLYTQVGKFDNLTISDCLLDGYQAGLQSSGEGSHTNNNWVFERNVCLNGYSSGANHGEWINADGKSLANPIIRHNLFKGSNGGMTGIITANNSNIDGALIYGNIFDNVSVGNGIIAVGSTGRSFMNSQIYNNTFLNSSGAWIGPNQSGYNFSGMTARNNFIYGMNASIRTSGIDSAFNTYSNTSGTPAGTNHQTGANITLNSSYVPSVQTAAVDPNTPRTPHDFLKDRHGVMGNTRGAIQVGGSSPSTPHPADANSDFVLALNEATAFGACWKNNCQANATLDNAVRAGTIWAGSATGAYEYNSAMACPLCWTVKP